MILETSHRPRAGLLPPAHSPRPPPVAIAQLASWPQDHCEHCREVCSAHHSVEAACSIYTWGPIGVLPQSLLLPWFVSAGMLGILGRYLILGLGAWLFHCWNLWMSTHYLGWWLGVWRNGCMDSKNLAFYSAWSDLLALWRVRWGQVSQSHSMHAH